MVATGVRLAVGATLPSVKLISPGPKNTPPAQSQCPPGGPGGAPDQRGKKPRSYGTRLSNQTSPSRQCSSTSGS